MKRRKNRRRLRRRRRRTTRTRVCCGKSHQSKINTYFAGRNLTLSVMESPAVPWYPPTAIRYLSTPSATLKVEYSAYEILPSKSSRSILSMTSWVAVKP